MRILLVNQFFWPDSAATSQLLTDLARELVDQGNEVSVVCGRSDYSEKDISSEPAVKILRSPTLPFGRSKPARLLSYFSFFATAAVLGLTSARFDLVITLTTPPLLSVMGTLMKRIRGTRHFVWEMDVYPDIAADLGVMSADGVLTRTIGAIADFSRNHSDGVLALGPCMRDRLIRHGLAPEKIHVTENWADGRSIQPVPLRLHEEFRVLYSGNLGLAHDVDTIYGAMRKLSDDPRFRFIFAGGGAKRKALERECEMNQISNAVFRSYCKRGLLGQSLAEGDVGLVTQLGSCTGSVVPSKVYGIMAAGRPILYIGPRDTTPALMIERFQCGWQVDIGDVSGLVNLLQVLEADSSLVREAGARARQAFLDHYDLPIGVGRICAAIGAAQEKKLSSPPPVLTA